MSSDNTPDDEERQLTTVEPTRRQSMLAGLALFSLFDGDWSLFGVEGEGEAVDKLLDSGEPVIDLDDIAGVDIGAGLNVSKDGGEVTIDSQEVEDALLTVLNSGSSVSTTVEEIDFTSNLSASGSGSSVSVSANAVRELARVLDSGTEVTTNARELNFGTGLNVSATAEGAEVSASGGLTVLHEGTVSTTASEESILISPDTPTQPWDFVATPVSRPSGVQEFWKSTDSPPTVGSSGDAAITMMEIYDASHPSAASSGAGLTAILGSDGSGELLEIDYKVYTV